MCTEHLDYCGNSCSECGLPVDDYGNTEMDFKYCSFPDCGCDGARLCMAKNGASDNSLSYNVEGMYNLKDPKPRMRFLGFIFDQKSNRAYHDAMTN